MIEPSTETHSPRAVLSRSALRFADHDALHIPAQACKHYASNGFTYTYRELDTAVTLATDRWRQTGVGGRIALVLENRAEFFIQWLALNALGVSVIPINHEMSDDEILYYLAHGEATAICCLADHLARMQGISNTLDSAIPVTVCSDVQQLRFELVLRPDEPRADTECALLYTSGSTGKPKACILSNDYFIQQGVWYQSLDGHVSLQEGQDRLLTPLPLSHMNAMSVSTMAMFMTGGCLIQLDRFHPSTWWESVRESRATSLHYLGVLPAILLALPEQSDDDFSDQIRFGFGAGVNPAHHARFETRFGFPLIEAWAMTECGAGGAIIANREPRHVGRCCFGTPLETVDWQLVDEQGQTVAFGEPGELRVRAKGNDPGKGFFSGYLKNADATAEIWADGWLNTGDVVIQLEDQSLAFVDRRKNIIRRSGENISALEIEAVMSHHAAIQAAIATPVPDEMRGDEVALCVILEAGWDATEITARDLQAHAMKQLAYFKAPGWVVFCDELPVTASNKPRRADIKVLARQRVGEGLAFDIRDGKKRQASS